MGAWLGKSASEVTHVNLRTVMTAVGLLIVGTILGVVLTWILALRDTVALLDQYETISRLLRDAAQEGSNAKLFISQVEDSGIEITDYDPNLPEVIEIASEVNIIGIGGRWIIFLRLDEDQIIQSSYVELQPRGWP